MTDVTKVIVAGVDDRGLIDAFESNGVDIVRIETVATRETLVDAGIDDADVLVLTDMDDATAISVAKDENPRVRVVTYALRTLPEFAKAQTDLALDPHLFDPTVVAEELVGPE